MIKVIQLIGSTGVFGAERWILALMRYLDPKEVHCTIVNLVDEKTEEDSPIVAEAHKRGLDAIDFYTGGKFNPLAASRLASWLDKNQYNILHSHGYKSDFLAYLTKKKKKDLFIISTPHGWSKEADLKLRLYERADRFLLKRFDCVVPLSTKLLEGLKADGISSSKLRLILNAVDVEEIDNIASKDLGPYIYVGYIGRLIESKGLKSLLDAFKILISQFHNLRLGFVGKGPFEAELIKMVRDANIVDKVEFWGYQSNSIAYLKAFSVFVLPSFSEGIPRCIMEAMAARVPVVASNIEGNRVLVEDKKTGLLFPVGDAKRLADSISYILTNESKAKEMVENARAKIERDFSAKTMAEAYTRLYNEIVKV